MQIEKFNLPLPTLLFRLSLVLLLLAVPFGLSNFYIELVAKVLVFAIFAMSLDFLVGYTGLVSFGHAAYFGVSAYAVVLLSAGQAEANLWILMLQSIGFAILTALVVGLFVLRTKGIYFIMVTLAFAQMLFFIFHDTPVGGGSDGIYLDAKPSASFLGFNPLDLNEISHLYGLIFVFAMLVFAFLNRLLESPLGRILQGIRSNEHRMQSLGYSTYWYKLIAFVIAGALAGLAGFLYAVMFGFVTPELLSWHESGNVLLMVILGGMGNLMGAILGAFAFVAMQEFFADITEHWALLMGTVIVFAVMFLPGGLMGGLKGISGQIQKMKQWFTARSAS
jgi:branched-chain amino acid transport system permease protein